MERPGTLKAGNRDLNHASATLAAEPWFLSRMETIILMLRWEVCKHGLGYVRWLVWGKCSVNVCFLLLDIL